MLTITITIDDAIRALKRLEDSRLPTKIAEAVANEVVLPALVKYPAASRRTQPFVSAKQRKYFFAALRRGQIEVPYRRTGDLGSRWAKQPFGGGLALRSTIGYSELVVGDGGKQAAYHRGTWPSMTETAKRSEADAALAATAIVVKTIGDAGP
jgi:hypothetical protein